MKINVIGPSASGKTRLAHRLGEELGVESIPLDYILFDFVNGKRIRVDESVWQEKLSKLLNNDDWIIEGINPVLEVLEASDKIIYLKPPLPVTIFRQWKRYFTDEKQRQEYGFINNLNLSKFIILQYLHKSPEKEFDNPRYNRLEKTERWLRRYSEKVIRF